MTYEALGTLMGGYYHQDFHDDYGGIWQALDAFLAEEPSLVGPLIDDIEELLASANAEADVKRAVWKWGCRAKAPEYETYRGWLEEIARRVSARCN